MHESVGGRQFAFAFTEYPRYLENAGNGHSVRDVQAGFMEEATSPLSVDLSLSKDNDSSVAVERGHG